MSSRRVNPFGLYTLLIAFIATFVSALPLEKRAGRTSPPSGSLVVRQSPGSGEYGTIQAAINALPNDSSSRSIFINAGTYNEQVSITRAGTTSIYGYTSDTSNYSANQVTISQSKSAAAAGSNDASATLRVHKDSFFLYNVNVKNTFGKGSQALALSAYGNKQGYYSSAFYGYQDTVLANTGTQYFGHCYIEGATDFIFGQQARAYFNKNTIAIIGAGYITANGRDSDSNPSFYVINASNVIQGSSVSGSLNGKTYLGRPWRDYSRVAFTSCNLGAVVNSAGWSVWGADNPQTDHVTYVEYANTGPGASGTRASFSKKVTSITGYDIGDILGSDWSSWVDGAYV